MPLEEAVLIHCGRFKMQSKKEQGILHFVTRNIQLSEKNNFQSGHEASTNIQIYNNLQKRIYSDMLTVPERTKNRKGGFVRQYVEKCVGNGFIAGSCSENPLGPYV